MILTPVLIVSLSEEQEHDGSDGRESGEVLSVDERGIEELRFDANEDLRDLGKRFLFMSHE